VIADDPYRFDSHQPANIVRHPPGDEPDDDAIGPYQRSQRVERNGQHGRIRRARRDGRDRTVDVEEEDQRRTRQTRGDRVSINVHVDEDGVTQSGPAAINACTRSAIDWSQSKIVA